MRIWLAIRAFFAVVFSRAAAERVGRALESLRPETEPAGPSPGAPCATVPAERKAPAKPPPMAPIRSEALTLLAALQREARLVDLILEPLDQYPDAQIGAAAREVLRNAAKTLDRFFGIRPVVQVPEGSQLEIPQGFDPNRYRLIGQLSGQPPFRGQLVHPGWEATRCELPSWTGPESAAWVIAPAEVEISS